MLIYGMTGFGAAEVSQGGLSLSVEVKGYNNRYLDLQFSLSPAFSFLEDGLRDMVKSRCTRGRVELYLRYQYADEQPSVSIDRGRAAAIVRGLHELKAGTGVRGRVELSHLLGFEGVIKLEKTRNLNAFEELARQCCAQAFDAFVESRARDGAGAAQDIAKQLERFEQAFSSIANREGDIEAQINTQLRSRFEAVLGDKVEEDRILNELASLLVKHSINEEIQRLGAHIEQFKTELNAGGALGKRLDFLCQEMNRETNTIGSKNIMIEISTQVIEMKDSLENIREQLRNIE